MDFEDALCLFFVRKDANENEDRYGAKYKQGNFKDNVHSYIPLMVKHIQTLSEDSWKDNLNIKIFNKNILFKHCLVYGKIIGRGKETENTYSYLLDDGTGCVNIKIFRRLKEMETVWKVGNELKFVKKDILAQNKNEIVKSLQNLLLQTEKQMDNSSIPNGCKVLVYGKPSYYRGQVSLDIYHVIQDEKKDRDIEITFKDQLIHWYTKNVLH